MDVNTNARLGRLLKDLRKEAGLTQTDMAKLCGVRQSYVCKIEQGERSLLLSELDLFAQALGFDSEQLFDLILIALSGDESR